MRRSPSVGGLLLAGCVLAVTAQAAIKVKTDHDPSFDFTKARTWAWNASEAGRVVLARSASDRPEELKARAEPVIMAAVATELARRKLQPAATGAPDLTVSYSLLITAGTRAQVMGQFVPSTTEWGLLPFSGATQALRAIEQGSIVLDMTANDKIVWRGVGQAEIKLEMSTERRRKLIEDAIRDVLAKYPPEGVKTAGLP